MKILLRWELNSFQVDKDQTQVQLGGRPPYRCSLTQEWHQKLANWPRDPWVVPSFRNVTPWLSWHITGDKLLKKKMEKCVCFVPESSICQMVHTLVGVFDWKDVFLRRSYQFWVTDYLVFPFCEPGKIRGGGFYTMKPHTVTPTIAVYILKSFFLVLKLLRNYPLHILYHSLLFWSLLFWLLRNYLLYILIE